MKVQFTTDNAAFEGDDKPLECARILRVIADKLEHGERDGDCRDYNGNKVGTWQIGGRRPRTR